MLKSRRQLKRATKARMKLHQISNPESRRRKLKILAEATAPIPEGDEFVIEGHAGVDSESSFFVETESPRQLISLQPAPFLKDITNVSPTRFEPPMKMDKLGELEEIWGLDRSGPT